MDDASEAVVCVCQGQRLATQQDSTRAGQGLHFGAVVGRRDVEGAVVDQATGGSNAARAGQFQARAVCNCGRAGIGIGAAQNLVTAGDGKAARAVDGAGEGVVCIRQGQRLATQQHRAGAGQRLHFGAVVGRGDVEGAVVDQAAGGSNAARAGQFQVRADSDCGRAGIGVGTVQDLVTAGDGQSARTMDGAGEGVVCIRQGQRLATQQYCAGAGQRLHFGAVVGRGDIEDAVVDQAAGGSDAARAGQFQARAIRDCGRARVSVGAAQHFVTASDVQTTVALDDAREGVVRVRQGQGLPTQQHGARAGQRLHFGAVVSGGDVEGAVVDQATRGGNGAGARQFKA